MPELYDACGRLKVSPTSFALDLVKGDVAGVAKLHKFGKNPDIDIASGFEAIWNGGGDYTGHDPTGAETVEVVSSDANDDVGGTGALTVEVFGLDSSWAEQNETLTLTGAVAVETANTYIRLNRMIVRTAGSGGSSAGTLTASQKTSGDVFCVMPIGYNQTMIAAWTVPAGKTAHLLGWYSSFAGAINGDSDIRLLARPDGEVFQVKEERHMSSNGPNLDRQYQLPKGPYAAKTDIKIMANSDTNNTAVSAGFDFLIVDN